MPKENKKIKEQIKAIVEEGDEDLIDGDNVQDRLDNIDGRYIDESKESQKKYKK